MFKHLTASLALVGALAIAAVASGEQRYGPGVSDSEIKIGQTSTYSGSVAPTALFSARHNSSTSA